MARWVAGLDGCRGAWAGALLDLDDLGRHRCALFPTWQPFSTRRSSR